MLSHHSYRSSRGTHGLGLVFLLGQVMLAAVWAFPPAPYYTLYGMVRDQVGQTMTGEGGQVILLRGGEEVGRTPITGTRIEQNYELNMRLDQNRSGTEFYTEKAVAAGGLYRLVVSLNGELFYPIEVAGDLRAGMGGERVRLDLTLGEDLDGDGLPDVWEQWQLYQSGLYPDESGEWDLSLIDGSGDFDGDGQSNLQEYIAGTFAGDKTEMFELEIKEKTDEAVRLEFYAVTGKTYTIEASSDLEGWSRVAFSVGELGEGYQGYQSEGVGVASAYVVPLTTGKEFYRLSVR